MHQTKKGNQWHHGMKGHIGVDADSGLVHSVVGTAANVNDVTQAHALVHGQETDVFADAGYQGVDKRAETQEIKVCWHVAMRPGKRKVLDKSTPMGAIMDKLEHLKASIRAKSAGCYGAGALSDRFEEHGCPTAVGRYRQSR